jgi:nucleotide-binding universal stress UspA family protein
MATPTSILVPIVQSEASFDAVTIAATLAKQKKGHVYVVHVIEVNRSLPLNAELEAEARRGEQLVRRAEEVAASAGHPVSGTLLQAREAGEAIVEEARDHGVEAIIMGVPTRRTGGSSQLGRTADFVLKNATCAVWVVRQSMTPRPADHLHE